MAIIYNEKNHIFKLDTKNTSYLIGISPEGYVGHVYYGEKLAHEDAYYLLRTEEPPFTPSKNEIFFFRFLPNGISVWRSRRL